MGGLLAFAIVLPWLIEGTRLAIPALGRTCRSVDPTTNLLALAIGLAAGLLARRVAVAARSGDGRHRRGGRGTSPEDRSR